MQGRENGGGVAPPREGAGLHRLCQIRQMTAKAGEAAMVRISANIAIVIIFLKVTSVSPGRLLCPADRDMR